MDRHEALGFLPLQDEAAEPFIRPIPEELRLASYHLMLPSGGWLSGGRAVIPLFLALRRYAWLGRALRALHATPVLGALYVLVSRSRGRLSPLVPDKPGPRRLP